MRKLNILLLFLLGSLSSNAQFFNFSLKTNNQQLIDLALTGSFVKINQSYELCDTTSNEHFGRNDNDYFSIVPFIGIETERGLCYQSDCNKPWLYDADFKEYEGKYVPILTGSTCSILNNKTLPNRQLQSPLSGIELIDGIDLYNDSTIVNRGLRVDTIAGAKDGWLVWFSSPEKLDSCDSIKITSIHKLIDIPSDLSSMSIDSPDISENVYGGIFITPSQTEIGQITFSLTGVLIKSEDRWDIVFPFINKSKTITKPLTPIGGNIPKDQLNQLKRKRK